MEEIQLKDQASGRIYTLTPNRGDTDGIHQPIDIETFLRSLELLRPGTWPEVLEMLGGGADADNAMQAVSQLIDRRQYFIRTSTSTRFGSRPADGHKRTSGGGSSSETLAVNAGSTYAGRSAPLAPESVPAGGDQVSSAPATVGGSAQGSPPVEDCATEGCPISMVSGEELLQLTDATLPGPMAIHWQRTFRSGHRTDIGLGSGWTHSFSETLSATSSELEYRDSEARSIRFFKPQTGAVSRYQPEGLELRHEGNGYRLSRHGQYDKIFTPVAAGNVYRLSEIRHPAWHDGQGFALQLHYGPTGALERLTGNWGKALKLVRDNQGHIRQVELHNTVTGRSKVVAEYDYNDQRELIAQRNGAGRGETYRFDNGQLAQRTLATGFSYYYEWDDQGRCTHTWGDRGIYDYRFTWDPDNRHTTATDSRGFTKHYYYDEHGRITRKTDPEGGEHHYQYDGGALSCYTDPEGASHYYFFDEQQRPLGERDPLDQRVSLSYSNGRCTLAKDKAGGLWQYSYNRRGLLESSIDPAGRKTEFRYTGEGLLAQSTHLAGTTRYRWNLSGELAALVLPNGLERHFDYNDWGQIVSAETRAPGQPSGAITRFNYTDSGRLADIIAADGARTSYTYNGNDQLLRHSDPRGRLTEFRYDGLSQVIERRNGEGHSLKYQYDQERNLTALINENGERYQFFYDGNERLIKEIGFDGRIQHYKYNAAGHLIKHLDAGAVITDFERDALGRMTRKTSRRVGDDSSTETSRYLHDPLGRLLETYNADQYLSFEYDPLGNLISESHCDLNDKRERVLGSQVSLRYRHHPSGQPASLQLPDGNRISYHYNDQLQLEQVNWNSQTVTRFERDSLGRERIRHQGDLSTHSDYDPMGRLLRQQAISQTNRQHHPIQRQYQYDQYGNLSLLKDGPSETRYVYDLLNRLKLTETRDGETHEQEQFAFDPASNLLVHGDGSGGQRQSLGNRLAFQGDRKFEYDKRGNLIRENRGKNGKLETRYEYNLQNQLTALHRDGQSTRYRYDPLGRRISKQDTFGTTRYLWAGDQMVQETRNQQTKSYVYEPGSFKPLAQIQDDNLYHYHLDHLGTPRELSDDNGKIVWRARYKTYGNVAVKDVEEVENNLRFQGQYFDEESGLHYNRHRYYNPGTGQFISQDPIGLLGGSNNYQYAPNPIQWVDPLGLKCKEGYAIVRQFENGRQEGHFTVEVVHGDLNYATHQTILSSDWEETTIVRAGRYNSAATAVHEAIIPLPDAEAAIEYQRNMINSPLGPYEAYGNSCLSHVVDVLSAGDGPVYGKTRLGYGKFYRKHGFGRLNADKSILDGG